MREFKLAQFESYLALWDIEGLREATGMTCGVIESWLDGSRPRGTTTDRVIAAFNEYLGLELAEDDLWHAHDPRYSGMLELENKGMDRVQIAKAYGLTRERVRQILGNKTREKECLICDELFVGSGKCCSHKCRSVLYYHGGKRPLYTGKRFEELCKQVTGNGSCWEWPTVGTGGVLKVSWNGRSANIRKVFWRLMGGVDGIIDVSCGNELCCNPNHLVSRPNKRRSLSDNQVREIKKSTGYAIGKRFGISNTSIDHIRNGRAYKEIQC